MGVNRIKRILKRLQWLITIKPTNTLPVTWLKVKIYQNYRI